MKFGLSPTDYEFILNQLKGLRDKGARVWCFGSRARGDHRAFSDLDIMVDADFDMSVELRRLREVFEESRLPIKVDLIDYSDFAESYRDDFLRERVDFFGGFDRSSNKSNT